ncbi:GXWXG domain-containing protein [Streptomyces prunicolor]
MDAIAARSRFAELRKQEGRISAAELDEIWAALDTVRPEEILGEQIRWYGKRFVSVKDVKPLLCRDDQGELFSHTGTLRS